MATNDDALARHQALVAGLQQHLASAGQPVERIDTHISTLLLAGEQAYKLKKPLALGFLDFSTLAARHQSCVDELRLNRRTAPQIYQAVVPVLGPAGQPRFGPADAAAAAQVLDWAVRMRRFDRRMGLDQLAAAGQLGATHIDRLADVLTTFQQALPPADAQEGDPARALHWAQDSLDALRHWWPAGPHSLGSVSRVDALTAWVQARWRVLSPRMQVRRETGCVREGHGDLHLANIVWLDGVPVPFDALEFNTELRCIDVVNELAFPFMDLQAHGLPALAWRLANRWFETTGDHAGAALLPWYAVERALVRAKVALIGAAEAGCAAAQRMALLTEAGRYLATAEVLAAPPAPQLVVVWGLSGTGKSTVALAVAETLGALRLRSDVERKRLHGLPPTYRPTEPAQIYNPASTQRTYARLGELAGQLLDDGLSVVVDAACLLRTERDALRTVARGRNQRCTLLQCTAPEATLHERIAARQAGNADASDATTEVLASQQQWLQPVAPDERADSRTLDTSEPLASVLQASRLLAAGLRAPA
ncbi:MAG: AAA family ATPase [Burkholderiales bacterium]